MFVFELIFGHCMSSTLTATIFLQTPHAVTPHATPAQLQKPGPTPAQHDQPVLRSVTGVVRRPPVLQHLFPTACPRVSLTWAAFHLGHASALLSFPKWQGCASVLSW